MKIVPTERIDWPPPYKEATEKYASQVRLTTDRRSLVGYVAGQPFPLLDPNDPEVATKIMWNYFFRPVSTDDYDLRFFDCESVYSGLNKPYKVLCYYSVGHYAGYMEVGRTEVQPMPVDPDFLKSGRYAMTGLYPQLAPQDGHGSGFLRYRYADPNRADDSWSYNPQSRRMRRLNDTLMSTAQDAGPESYSPDDFECFAGKNENYNWKYLGERQMLGAINDPQSPPPTCPTDGGGSHCPANWQMRHMYILEGIARPNRLAGDLYSKHVLYIDSEADFGMYQDQYDPSSTTLRGSSSRTACALTRVSRSIRSSASSRPDPRRPMCSRVCRRFATIRATTCLRRSVGISTWARLIGASSTPIRSSGHR